ncbi:bifunctional 2-polyprenyl-6-hydroxyphenol methylase/3-demethylubiquinol 3-O-methyltransferase UbiG [Sandaracinobacter neustonicus]|uniref:Ubiquinone biosynthesis O-methyltransferase n=1 Tax=Sandaracinobacter neustonicus TaxID=1715348 RepID=A0A501XEY7_9SPHN|nr:bifunctional 2-polyprenyl-6-hydroxyphenol methylase/3-demethylubiquinol 3-O-methyltransferase UbiG [Sandaracinobacter neustonicus]TPE59076.1 bifunctional 2-polyprenyl-6-hydroxyphenol methylase/3-demethylubiquinol 3-O-methyltransferase UbiG [Sandaracinobacter neustonicus]
MQQTTQNAENIALFAGLAADWWNPEGSSRLLHRINPTRLGFIRDSLVHHFGLDPRKRRALEGLSALDIGCGAGLVTEPLARMGADTQGLDAGADLIEAARAHAAAQQLPIRYTAADITDFAPAHKGRFDIVTCLEVVEHVADIPAFLAALASLLKPGGLLIFSTPNRTPLSWAVLIAGAEKITRMIPDGGHDWHKFLTPDELTRYLAEAGLKVETLKGLNWSPAKGFHISDDVSITYIGTAVRV